MKLQRNSGCITTRGVMVLLALGSAFTSPAQPLTAGAGYGPPIPARPGEILVAYAVGLGRPASEIATGEAVPAPTPLAETLWLIDFNFTQNSGPRWLTSSASSPLYVGLVPGFVGLYQVNFRIPAIIPPGTPKCGNGVRSNLTVSILSPSSFDGGAVCVN